MMCSAKSRISSILAFYIRLLMVLASFTFSINAYAEPQIVSPPAGSTLSGSEQTFSWKIDSAHIERVWLYVGTTVGGRDIVNSLDLGTDTEYDVIGIPANGSTLHARLWYYTASQWLYVDTSYTAANLDYEVATPGVYSPDNSELAGASVDFKWSDNNTLVNYWWLYLGTAQGGKNLYDSRRSLRTQTSVTVDDLPTDGSVIHARLWFRTAADGWKYVDSQYQSGPEPTRPPAPPLVPNTAPEILGISLGCDLVTESVSIRMGDSAEFFLLVDDESPLDLKYEVNMQNPNTASVTVDSEGQLLVSGLSLGRSDLSVNVVDSEGLNDTVVIRVIVDL